MNRVLACILAAIIISSCKPKVEQQTPNVVTEEVEAPNFFPVTNYLYGQIEGIKQSGVNPIKIDSSLGKTDTAWLKIEDLKTAFQEFLTPNIDHDNLVDLYTESKFEDKSLDAYTFTYIAKGALPDSISLQRWDVHVSPASSTVKRIYLVKKINAQKELQLTWQSGQWCKIVSIVTDAQGQQSVASVQTIKWKFD